MSSSQHTNMVISPGASSCISLSMMTSPSSFSTPSRSTSIMMMSGGGGGNSSKILHPVRRIVLVGEGCNNNERVLVHARRFSVPVLSSDDASDFLASNDVQDVAFVLDEFSGRVFEALNRAEATIFGPTALEEMSRQQQEDGGNNPPVLYMSTRPLFSTSMKELRIVFNGKKKENKEELKRFLFMIHSMGGRVMGDIAQQKPKVTHLVANNCKGDMYTYASTFEIPIVQGRWITEAWERRREVGFSAGEATFQTAWKVMPFHGAHIFFLGFQEEEKRHMLDELARNGGKECQSYQDPSCTHVVLDNTTVQTMPSDIRRDVHVVKMEWFWASIQMDACAEEKLHLFSDYITSFMSPRGGATAGSSSGGAALFSPSTPGSHGRRKKRRTEAVRQLAQSDVPSLLHSSMKKARSSLGDLQATAGSSSSFVLSSTSGSLALLDTPDKKKAELAAKTGTPNKDSSAVISPQRQQQQAYVSPQKVAAAAEVNSKPRSARYQVFDELVQTERNYVGILSTIDEVFKRPLEDGKMTMLLNQTQMKIIFGNVTPILQVHKNMLADLEVCLQDWKENRCIGNIIGKYAHELMRAYPPFVNFFEDTKKTLDECDKTNPRFHAFLKVCQSRNECGRQTLAELLIRPVQRLGSITLLLKDLLKHTKKEKDHPDGPALEAALEKIKEVLTNINDDKRKTEGQIHIFDIFNDIENCPPHLVSSNRNFVAKIDVVELGGSDELCGKGSDLTLFLFSDVLEICKRRRHHNGGGGGGGGGSSLISKSPSTMSLRNTGGLVNAAVGPMMMQHHAPSRPHKHIQLMNLTAIRRVVDILVSEECQDCFALVCRTTQELKERMFVFQIINDNVRKDDFLRLLCRNVANAMYRQDPDTYLAQLPLVDLGLGISDLSVNKTYRSLHRVKKAFSFSRTPTTSRLTRVVSGMISPLSSYRDRMNSTPSGDLENLRLQSCCNLMGAATAESPARRMTMTPGRRFPPMGPPSMPSPSMMMSRAVSTVAASCSSSSSSECGSMDSPKSVKSGGFTIPKTPTHSVRRASFKFFTNTLGKKY